MRDDDVHEHDRGLAHDLPRLISRRRALGTFAGSIGAVALAACGGSSSGGGGGGSAATTATTDSRTPASTGEVPDETAGPFPGDGSNGPNVLSESGVVRRDITKSIGDASGVAAGIPTTLELTLLDVAGGGKPLAGAAVYVWHCDREGRYSLYDDGVTGENYLRGVQESGRDGRLSFDTIFPAAYQGRWPHIHFEVYEDLEAATSGGRPMKTSQIALPAETSEQVYATDGYEQSVRNLSQTSLETDLVFSDGYASQLAKTTGSVREGFAARLNVGV